MRITWMGHACFLLETVQGTKIITDPYEPGSYGGAVGYDSVDIQADIVTVSHQHADHNYLREFSQAKIINKKGDFKISDVSIKGLESFHDNQKGASRGENIIFIIETKGLRVAHFGDLGTLDIDYTKVTDIDIALVPVGGTFTLDAQEAAELVQRINPKVTIPMHFKTSKLGFDIAGVERFLEGKDYQRKDIFEATPPNINSFSKIVVLKHQR